MSGSDPAHQSRPGDAQYYEPRSRGAAEQEIPEKLRGSASARFVTVGASYSVAARVQLAHEFADVRARHEAHGHRAPAVARAGNDQRLPLSPALVANPRYFVDTHGVALEEPRLGRACFRRKRRRGRSGREAA